MENTAKTAPNVKTASTPRQALQNKLDLEEKRNKSAHMILCMCGGLCAIMALVPQLSTACAILMLPLIGLLFFHEDFYILAAIFIFFTEQLTITAGAPINRVFQYITFLRFFVYDFKGLKFRVWVLPAMLVFALYGFFVMPSADVSFFLRQAAERGSSIPSVTALRLKLTFNFFCDLLYLLITATKIYSDKRMLDKFLHAFVLVALCSGVYGLRAGNVFSYKAGYVEGGTRMMASFNDPNYASCFMNMAIFITLAKFDKLKLKIPIVGMLYVFLVAAGSMTGFILNVVGMAFFAVIRYRKRAIIALVAMAILGAGGIAVIFNVPAIYNTKAVKTVMTRIEYQYINPDGDGKAEILNTMTSGRSGQWVKYMNYYNRQSTGQKLFGGNLITSSAVSQHFMDAYINTPHEAYIGFLLDFGLIGTVIVMLAFFTKAITHVVLVLKKRDKDELALLMTTFVWFAYGFALDYFCDPRFMTFFFL